MRRFSRISALFVAATAAAFAVPAAAQASRQNLPVTTEVLSACNVTATPMEFGQIDPAVDTMVETTATVTVSCISTTIFRIQIDRGLNANGTERRMINASGDFLAYEIYRNNNRTQDWGVLPIAARNGIIVGGGSADFTAYGRIPVITAATPRGSYSDTVTVTINF